MTRYGTSLTGIWAWFRSAPLLPDETTRSANCGSPLIAFLAVGLDSLFTKTEHPVEASATADAGRRGEIVIDGRYAKSRTPDQIRPAPLPGSTEVVV